MRLDPKSGLWDRIYAAARCLLLGAPVDYAEHEYELNVALGQRDQLEAQNDLLRQQINDLTLTEETTR